MNVKLLQSPALCGLILTCALLSSPTTWAVSPEAPSGLTTPSIRIHYSGADLSQPDRTRELYRAIRTAARQVCGSVDTRDLARRAIYEGCYRSSVDDALAQVNRYSALRAAR